VPARRWLKEVGRVLGPQQVTKGGPILMLQVENEYGFYGDDVGYLRVLRQTLLDSGFNVPLWANSPPGSVTQEVRFAAPAGGRQFCPESLDAFDGKPYASVAELSLLDRDGKPLDQSNWTVAWSEQ
jgi:hypothetical protein